MPQSLRHKDVIKLDGETCAQCLKDERLSFFHLIPTKGCLCLCSTLPLASLWARKEGFRRRSSSCQKSVSLFCLFVFSVQLISTLLISRSHCTQSSCPWRRGKVVKNYDDYIWALDWGFSKHGRASYPLWEQMDICTPPFSPISTAIIVLISVKALLLPSHWYCRVYLL